VTFVPTRNTEERQCARQFLDRDVFPRNFEQSCPGIGVAVQVGMRKIAAVVVVAALFASTAAISVKHQRRWTEKLDAGLVHMAQEGNNDLVQLLILVEPGKADQFQLHLGHHGLKAARVSAPDIVAVDMPGSMLRTIAGDSDVIHLAQRQ
jgi:hypothetical protein